MYMILERIYLDATWCNSVFFFAVLELYDLLAKYILYKKSRLKKHWHSKWLLPAEMAWTKEQLCIFWHLTDVPPICAYVWTNSTLFRGVRVAFQHFFFHKPAAYRRIWKNCCFFWSKNRTLMRVFCMNAQTGQAWKNLHGQNLWWTQIHKTKPFKYKWMGG